MEQSALFINDRSADANTSAAFGIGASIKAFSEISPLLGGEFRNLIWKVIRWELSVIAEDEISYRWNSSLWGDFAQPNWLESVEYRLKEYLLVWGNEWLEFWSFYFNVKMGKLFTSSEIAISRVAAEPDAFWARDPDEVMKDITSTLSIRLGGDFVLPSMTVSANLKHELIFLSAIPPRTKPKPARSMTISRRLDTRP